MPINQHQPRKRFGQHFLHDAFIIEQMLTAISPQPYDHLVEIGPGLGALTIPLLRIASQINAQLEAIELDRDVIPKLQQQCYEFGAITIYQADALRFDFTALASSNKPLRIFGNLPYNISTPLLFHLLQQRTLIQDMHFMLQKEVVERIVAQPGTAHYGRLSIMIQYFCSAMALFEIPPTAFTPPPRVYSAVVRLIPYANLPIPANDFNLFSKVVTTAFTQRRKTLRNALKSLANSRQLQTVDELANLRPEQLSIADYVRVSNLLSEK
jgi:16S rRNA (adenine1518-N6/adenine1519-N6)-dimethyltransferase